MKKYVLITKVGLLVLMVAFGISWGLGGYWAHAAGGPELGKPAGGPMIDKSSDQTLQKMIAEILPKFRQLKYEGLNFELPYSLYVPENMAPGEKYPLVLFIADASTPGRGIDAPLTQGYGGLVWATPEAQSKNPCYVLVPQFSGVAVNDAYEHTPEADAVIRLLMDVAANNAVDTTRLYVTGQSMGGMLSMYYNIAYPGIFAASMFVDCHWDSSKFDQLVMHPFIFVYAGEKGKAWKNMKSLEEAARKMSLGYAWAEWSARLPQKTQDELAANLLAKGEPINFMGFETGTVLPENGKGSEHMYSFDHAYKLAPAREWLFGHRLEKPGL